MRCRRASARSHAKLRRKSLLVRFCRRRIGDRRRVDQTETGVGRWNEGVLKEWLASIVSRIADGTLLSASYFADLDCDAALDARDGDDEFVAEWNRLFEDAGRRWAVSDVADEIRSLAEDVRQESFLAVSRATGQHEIASYVSDDFDLIVRGRLLGMSDQLPEQLWDRYERGEFPTPPL